VVAAIREQNVQVAGLDRPAAECVGRPGHVNTLGRLTTEEQFGDIVIKAGADGQVTRLRDVAHRELGRQLLRAACSTASRRWGYRSSRARRERAGCVQRGARDNGATASQVPRRH
jgi:hypothetical protein